MMRISLLILVLATIVNLGCQKDNDTSDDPFFGTWEIVAATGFAADSNVGTEYTFREDGSITLQNFGISNSGTFVRTDSDLTISLSGIDLLYTYQLAGSRLTLDNQTADQVFTLEKK